MLVLIIVAGMLGLFGYRELRDLGKPQHDAGWTIFQMGFENQRLLLAAETGASQAELRLRGDIYLSRVFLLRDAPMLANVREVMNEALAKGGTSFDSLYVNVNGESGWFEQSLAAYGQEGEPCPRCGRLIIREPFMNRSSYRCPGCQRPPARR